MKLHRLEIEGFGPFLRRQVIDFDDYDADGLFLIAGKTGAGKSSLLDAVCFALYASVPRYSSGGGKRVRSDHALADDPTVVSLTFSTGNETYRVTRSPEYERPKQRGGGMTTQAATVQLDRLAGDTWVGLASRAVDAGNQLAEILQLNKDQFLQVILLAQNRFAKFLLADSKERQLLLRTLFGTRRFEDYQRQLIERRKASEQTVAAARNRLLDRLADAEKVVDTHGWGDHHAEATAAEAKDTAEDVAQAAPDDTAVLPAADRVERLHRARERAAYRIEATTDAQGRADEARIAAGTAATAQRTRREQQQRRDAARVDLARLDERAAAVAAERTELAAARDAQIVATSIAAYQRDSAAAIEAAESRDTALAACIAAAGEPAGTMPIAELRALGDDRTATLGALATAMATEGALDDHRGSVHTAAEALAGAEAHQDHLRAEALGIPAQLAELDKTLLELQLRADRVGDLETRQAALEIQLDAAQQREGHERDRDRTLVAATEANKAARDAADALDALYQRKLRGSASELAATLVDGSACPVCGATAHPHPAPPLVDPVTDADLAAVTAERDARQQAATEASRAEQQAAAALTQIVAASGGRGLDELRDAQQTLTAELDAARAAGDEQVRVIHEREALQEREQSMAGVQETATAAVAAALTAHAAAQEQLRAAEALVASARDGYATVAERVAALTRERDAVQAYAAAYETAERADAAASAALIAQHESLDKTPFDSVDDAQRAARTAGQMTEIEARVTDYDTALRVTKATLMELELAALAEEPIDVTAAEAAAEAAQQEWARVSSDLTALRMAAETLIERTTAAESELHHQAESLAAHETIERLADTVSGHEPNAKRMSLETFMLAAELEEIVAAANVRLADMSSGRYRLQHSDERIGNAAAGLGIDIFDAFTSKARPAHSLSGGETFLASLALALGLAEVVTNRAGGVRLDTLFIDEGFGALDPDTLEVAMQTLDELRSGGRTVGIISHVEAMKEQIPAQLRVHVSADGSSDITTR